MIALTRLGAAFKNTESQLNGRKRYVGDNYRLGETLEGERASRSVATLPVSAMLTRWHFTYSHRQNLPLLYYLVGANKKHGWDGQPDRLRCLEIKN